MTADPVRTLSLDALLAEVPELRREVRELRAEVETLKSHRLQCPRCDGRLFRTAKTWRTKSGVQRVRECRGCGERVRTREEVIG